MKRISKNNVYNILSVVCFIYVIFISFFIYARIDQYGVMINNMFSTNISFVDLNKNIDNFFNNIFHIGIDEDKEVSGNVTYLSLGEHKFKMEDNRLLSLDNGTVTYLTMEDDYYAVSVIYNDFEVIYRKLSVSNVSSMDHILQGDIIGEYEDYFIANFFKEGKEVEFEQLQVSD